MTDLTALPAIDLSPEQRLLIAQTARRLEAEFSGTFNRSTIERYIADSEERLTEGARIATWLPVLVERFARERLRALARVEGHLDDRPAVLFLCVHNAGRSQMAAGWLRHLAGDAVDVFSGGSEPSAETNRSAVEAMAEVGIDIANEFPKPWTDEVAEAATVVVSMGCGDACPIFPGTRYEDWLVEDPADADLEAVRAIRDDLRERVEQLMQTLDVAVVSS